MLVSIIFIPLSWEIQVRIFVGRQVQDEQNERTEVLCISTQHQLQQWRLSTLSCQSASTLTTSQEELVVYASWSSMPIPLSMPRLFLLLNRETLYNSTAENHLSCFTGMKGWHDTAGTWIFGFRGFCLEQAWLIKWQSHLFKCNELKLFLSSNSITSFTSMELHLVYTGVREKPSSI